SLGAYPGRPQLLKQLSDENAVWSSRIARNFVGGRGVHSETAMRKVNSSEASRNRPEPPFVRVSARSVDDQDLNTCTCLFHLGHDRFDAGPIPADVTFGPDLCVRGNNIALL